jgi:hypothetical protein
MPEKKNFGPIPSYAPYNWLGTMKSDIEFPTRGRLQYAQSMAPEVQKKLNERDRAAIIKDLELQLRDKSSGAGSRWGQTSQTGKGISALRGMGLDQLVGMQTQQATGREKTEQDRISAETAAKAKEAADTANALGESLGVNVPAPGSTVSVSENQPDKQSIPVRTDREEANLSAIDDLMQNGIIDKPTAQAAETADKEQIGLEDRMIAAIEGQNAEIANIMRGVQADRPELFSPGSIMYMATFGPQAWLQRHDKLTDQHQRRLDQVKMLGLQGKMNEARMLAGIRRDVQNQQGRMALEGYKEQNRRERDALKPEKTRNVSPELVAAEIKRRMKPNGMVEIADPATMKPKDVPVETAAILAAKEFGVPDKEVVQLVRSGGIK